MARLGRSQVWSKLRPPVVVGAAVTFRPLKVTLSVNLTRREVQPQRKTRSRLYAPTTVGSATVFGPVRAELAPSSRLARASHSRLKPPAVVAAPVVPPTFEQLEYRPFLTRTPRQRIVTHSDLRAPAVVGAPVVVAAVDATFARRSLLDQARRAAHSRLQQPATLTPPAVPPVAEQLKYHAWLVETRPAATHSHLDAPAAVGTPVTYPPVKVELAPPGKQARATHSRLQAPASVAAAVVFAAVKVTLAIQTRDRIRRAAHSKLQPPATLAPAPQPPTREQLQYKSWLTRIRPAATHSQLKPPTVITAQIVPPTAEQLRYRTWLAKIRPPRFASKLQPPAVVGPAIVYAAVKAKLAATPRKYYRARSVFTTLPPGLGAVLPPTLEALKYRTRLVRIRPPLFRSKLSAPAVVGAATVFPAVKTKLVRVSQRYIRTRSFSTPLPPVTQVVGPTADQLHVRVALAAQAKRRLTYSRLRALFAPSPTPDQIKPRIALAAQPKQRQRQTYVLLAKPLLPVVLTLDQATPRTHLAAPHRPAQTHSVLRKPAAVLRPVLPEQQRVRIKVAWQPKQAQHVIYWEHAPTVIGPPLTGAIYTQAFGPASPDGNRFPGSPDNAGLHGNIDEGFEPGSPVGAGFRPGSPRRG